MKKYKDYLSVIVVLAILLGIPTALYIFRQYSFKPPQAAPNTVSVSITPQTNTQPPDTLYIATVNAKRAKIGFVRLVMLFDQAKLKLTKDVEPTDALKTVIKKTPFTEANTTGRVEIVLGLAPGDTAPTSSFYVAKYSFTSVSKIPGDQTTLSFDASDNQVVDMSANSLTVNLSSATVNLNISSPSPSPTTAHNKKQTPTPTPTYIPLSSPSATP